MNFEVLDFNASPPHVCQGLVVGRKTSWVAKGVIISIVSSPVLHDQKQSPTTVTDLQLQPVHSHQLI